MVAEGTGAQRGGAEQGGALTPRRDAHPRRQVAPHKSWNKFQHSKAAAPQPLPRKFTESHHQAPAAALPLYSGLVIVTVLLPRSLPVVRTT